MCLSQIYLESSESLNRFIGFGEDSRASDFNSIHSVKVNREKK